MKGKGGRNRKCQTIWWQVGREGGEGEKKGGRERGREKERHTVGGRDSSFL
jgi:hypothetical protein